MGQPSNWDLLLVASSQQFFSKSCSPPRFGSAISVMARRIHFYTWLVVSLLTLDAAADLPDALAFETCAGLGAAPLLEAHGAAVVQRA